MNPILHNFLLLFGYGLAGSIMMAIALGILIKIWNWLTPIDEWEELRKGNVAVAIVVAAVVLAFAIVVATASRRVRSAFFRSHEALPSRHRDPAFVGRGFCLRSRNAGWTRFQGNPPPGEDATRDQDCPRERRHLAGLLRNTGSSPLDVWIQRGGIQRREDNRAHCRRSGESRANAFAPSLSSACHASDGAPAHRHDCCAQPTLPPGRHWRKHKLHPRHRFQPLQIVRLSFGNFTRAMRRNHEERLSLFADGFHR